MGKHRTVEQKIAEAEAQLARLRKRQRADETRRKVLFGAYVEQMIENNQQAREMIMQGMDQFLTRDADRQLFDLPKREKKHE